MATARYLVAGTFGCYFTKAELAPSDTILAGDDGESLNVLRPKADKLCFPAIYFVVPRIGSFRTITNTVGVDFYSLTYDRWCMRDGLMQRTARTIDDVGFLNQTARSKEAFFPNAPLLRGAEGLDAITNALYSSEAKTNVESAGYLLCAIVRLPSLKPIFVKHAANRVPVRARRRKWVASFTRSLSSRSPSCC